MILSVDPGETTGLALRLADDSLVLSMVRGKEQLWKLLEYLGAEDRVVVEDFVTAGRISKHGLFTTRLVGSLEALCWLYGIPLQRQVPNFRMGYLNVSYKIINETVGADHAHRHEKDALAHLLAWEAYDGRPYRRGTTTVVRRTSFEQIVSPDGGLQRRQSLQSVDGCFDDGEVAP